MINSVSSVDTLRFHPAHRVTDQFRGGPQVELSFDVRAVSVHGLNTQVQLLGEFACALALAQQLEDLKFPIAELFDGRFAFSRLGRDALQQDG